MSELESFAKDRTVAKRKFTRLLNNIKTSITAKADQLVLKGRFEELKILWSTVQDKHDRYIASAFGDNEDKVQEEDAWIEEVESRYYQIEAEILTYLKSHDKSKSDDSKRLALMTRQVEEAALRNAMEDASTYLTEHHETMSVNMCNEIKENIRKQYDKCCEVNAVYVSLLKNSDELALGISWLTQLQTLHSKCQQDISKSIEQTPTHQSSSTSDISNIDLKLERMRLPRFTGEIRDYPRFKSDFNRHVLSKIKDTESASYILKSCLDDSVVEVVRNVDEDLDQMWRRLDDKFGRPSKLADIVIYDIKKLRKVEDGDNKRFIELVDVVETGYHDLCRINFEKEISNSAVVSMIEEKLPFVMQIKWSERVNKADSDVEEINKFPYLLKFLLEQKRVLEYVSADLRRGTSNVRGWSNHVDTSMDDEASNDQSQTTITGNSQCIIHNLCNHSTENCRDYLSRNPAERVKVVSSARACWSCLRRNHKSAECRSRSRCTKDDCTKFHHESLHEAHIQGINFVPSVVLMATKGNEEKGEKGSICLLQVMSIHTSQSNNSSVNVMWDGGATVSLITFKKARSLNLEGEPITITVIKVGGKQEKINSFEYALPLLNENNEQITLKVYGIEKISTGMQQINVKGVIKLFKDVHEKDVNRPIGEIDALIGLEYAGFHPVREQYHGHLLLLKNQFGKCLGGTHPLLKEGTRKLIQHVTIHHIKRVEIKDFYEIESMGVCCSPRCGGCKCGHCPLGGKSYTIQEERELKLIEDGLHHTGEYWQAKYPWIKNPNDLPDNYFAAKGMLISTEKRLQRKTENANLYQHQIEDMLERGVARKLSQDEINLYKGPIHYLSHHEVMKPDSTSTPCRIVFNSSANYQGHVLNNYWAKGPDLINNLLGILIRFREKPVPLIGDISKMYHSVKISGLDQHTHRFLWRDLKVEKVPDVYVMTSVSFGDKPAGNIATVALRKTANQFLEEYPQSVKVIIDNSYVDDIIDSVTDTTELSRVTNEINEILASGNFKIKQWISSCATEGSLHFPNCINHNLSSSSIKNIEKVLGMSWSPNSDAFHFKVRLNFSPKIRKLRTGSDLSKDDVPALIPRQLTKRMILSQVNGIYDPLGLATPFTVKAKMLMRKLFSGNLKSLGWDDMIPEDSRGEWVQLFTDMYEMEELKFTRCFTVIDSIGNPVLIIFSDASEDAFGTCAYLRYQLKDGSFKIILIMSKSRLSPLRIISIVRLELCAAVLSARIKKFLDTEMRITYSRVYFIVDSDIVRAMVQKESYGFNTFVAIRVGEIQEETDISCWYWVSGDLNIADLVTRGANPAELGESSRWQEGPEFLKLSEEMWPIRNEPMQKELPELAKPVLLAYMAAENGALGCLIDIQRFSSYIKLIRVTSRILSLKTGRSLQSIAKRPCVANLVAAKIFWVKEVQQNLALQLQNGKFERLCARVREDGIMIVGSRVMKNNIMSYDNGELMLLPANHHFSRLYAEFIHNIGHTGVSTTMAKIRLHFWIMNLRPMVKSIVYKCVVCKRNKAIVRNQIMAPLPAERLTPSPAWYTTYLDYFGPFSVRGEVNKRSRGKVYGLIFSCATSRAVHIDIAADYSTPGFFMVLRRFVTLRGYPAKMISDPGSQLVAADQELKGVANGISRELLIDFGADKGMDWHFTTPDAPWQNGCSEALIRTVKRILKQLIKDQVLSFSELQTVFYEIANLMNERPIGAHPTDPNEGSYLSPNHLLLGRATARVPSGPFKEATMNRHRFELVQQIIDSFWKRWIRDYFPTLMVRSKWHTEKRNVRVGDIVIVQESNMIRGKWRLAKVSKVFPGEDGLVRNVAVHYKNLGENESQHTYSGANYTEIKRAVQKIVVLIPSENEYADC